MALDDELPVDGSIKPERMTRFQERPEEWSGRELDHQGPYASILN